MTTLRAGSATHIGQVRAVNQDSLVVLADADVYAVADGMGGHAGGEVASKMAVDILEANAGEATLENLVEAARLGNRAIFERAGAEADLQGMGTTLCAVRVVPGADGEGDEIAWINVGDSRVYLYRDGRLVQLSTDHSLVEDLVRDGQLTPDEAAVHPKRNIITRALGIDVDVNVDGSTVIPYNDDRFVLCSDGLFGEISEDQIASVLRRLADPTEAAEELVRLANEAGGRDNITVVIVDVVDDDGRALKAAEAIATAQARVESDAAAAQPLSASALGDQPEPEYVPVFADRKSSLPDADADYGAEHDDILFGSEGLESKRFTWRVAVFVLAFLAIVAAVLAILMYSARGTYFVAFDGDGNVAIYQGKPDGFLWMDPELERTSGLTRDDLVPAEVDAVEDEQTFGSRDDAFAYVENLLGVVEEREAASTTTSTTSTTSTTPVTTSTAPSTTAPAPTTTPGPNGP